MVLVVVVVAGFVVVIVVVVATALVTGVFCRDHGGCRDTSSSMCRKLTSLENFRAVCLLDHAAALTSLLDFREDNLRNSLSKS